MPERRYFLDWLRVLAFVGLAAFHVGLVYSTWPYNMNSPEPRPAVEWLLEALIPWRMALLFVISGVACRFQCARLGAAGFARERLTRLLPVILTGMLLVNPVQAWVQLRADGAVSADYLAFWLNGYLRSDPALIAALGRPMPTWDHLWFLVYLAPYSLLLAAALPLTARSARLPLSLLLVLPGLWMAATNVLIAKVAPVTHALVDDWGSHLKWLGLFAAGAALAFRDDAWRLLEARRSPLLAAAAVMLAMTLACRAVLLDHPGAPAWELAYRVAQGAYGWTMILALAGCAAAWVNSPSTTLSYLNDAVLPVYVLHQPCLLAAAWILFPLTLPQALEAALLLTAAGLIPLAIYHLVIRPWPPVRLMFGLRPRLDPSRAKSAPRNLDAEPG